MCQPEVLAQPGHLFLQRHQRHADPLDLLLGEVAEVDPAQRLAFRQLPKQLDGGEHQAGQPPLDGVPVNGEPAVQRCDPRLLPLLRLTERHGQVGRPSGPSSGTSLTSAGLLAVPDRVDLPLRFAQADRVRGGLHVGGHDAVAEQSGLLGHLSAPRPGAASGGVWPAARRRSASAEPRSFPLIASMPLPAAAVAAALPADW